MAKVKGRGGPCNDFFQKENIFISGYRKNIINTHLEGKEFNALLAEQIENSVDQDLGLVKVVPAKKEESIKKEYIASAREKIGGFSDPDGQCLQTAVVSSTRNNNNVCIKPVKKWTELNSIKKPDCSYKVILPKDIFEDERPIGKTMWVCLTDLVNQNNLEQAEELVAKDIRDIKRIPRSTFQYEKVAQKRYFEIREILLERERRTSQQNPEEYANEVRSKSLFSDKQKNIFLNMVGNNYRDKDDYSLGRQ
jgi:hypothetical protein